MKQFAFNVLLLFASLAIVGITVAGIFRGLFRWAWRRMPSLIENPHSLLNCWPSDTARRKRRGFLAISQPLARQEIRAHIFGKNIPNCLILLVSPARIERATY
jgi:hypothetical protein